MPYGGKDALKNITILKFMLSRVKTHYITFDLDAAAEAKASVSKLGLVEVADFLAIGLDQPGKQAVEGLLPERILSAVYGREVSLVMASQAANAAERKSAKSKLKQLLLQEFKSGGPYDSSDLKQIAIVGKTISKKFK